MVKTTRSKEPVLKAKKPAPKTESKPVDKKAKSPVSKKSAAPQKSKKESKPLSGAADMIMEASKIVAK